MITDMLISRTDWMEFGGAAAENYIKLYDLWAKILGKMMPLKVSVWLKILLFKRSIPSAKLIKNGNGGNDV